MLKCADCGTLAQDGRTTCGVCGSARLYAPEQIVQPSRSKAPPLQEHGRSRAIYILTISIACFVGGFALFFSAGYAFASATSLAISLVGLFMIVFGGVVLISVAFGSVTGGFRYRSDRDETILSAGSSRAGPRHSGEAMKRADLEQIEREKERKRD